MNQHIIMSERDIKEHKGLFNSWKKRHKVFNKLSDVIDTDIELHIGQPVIYTNGYGVEILLEITGFRDPDFRGACVYLSMDCYWYPVRVGSIKPVEG
jgi:hypothetical protein